MITHEPEFLPPPSNLRGRLGRAVLLTCRNAGRALLILWEALLSLRFVLSKRSRPWSYNSSISPGSRAWV